MSKKKEKANKNTSDPLMNLKFSSQRTLAMSSGDLRSAVLNEVDRMMDDNRNHPVKACCSGLSRLVDQDLLSKKEANKLEEICKVVFDRQRNKMSINQSSRIIDGIYHPLITQGNASPVALAIASMAVTTETPKGKSLSAAATRQSGDIGMLGGAIAGAAIGGAIGGAGGAVIGSVIGGISGGVAGACSD